MTWANPIHKYVLILFVHRFLTVKIDVTLSVVSESSYSSSIGGLISRPMNGVFFFMFCTGCPLRLSYLVPRSIAPRSKVGHFVLWRLFHVFLSVGLIQQCRRDHCPFVDFQVSTIGTTVIESFSHPGARCHYGKGHSCGSCLTIGSRLHF